jgi:DNA-binding CsgD family transcriptional regulator
LAQILNQILKSEIPNQKSKIPNPEAPMLRKLLSSLIPSKPTRKRTPGFFIRSRRPAKSPARPEACPFCSLADGLLDSGLDHLQLTEGLLEHWGSLTRRERQVALLLLRDLNYDQIAKYLTISRETVKTHTHHILEKFGVNSARELRHAIQSPGLLAAKKSETLSIEDEQVLDREFKPKSSDHVS